MIQVIPSGAVTATCYISFLALHVVFKQPQLHNRGLVERELKWYDLVVHSGENNVNLTD
jgi:hypothetical protein